MLNFVRRRKDERALHTRRKGYRLHGEVVNTR
jgi:hypothetical protein